MCDFTLEIEGQEDRGLFSGELDVEKFPKDGVLRAKIKSLFNKEQFVYWDLKNTLIEEEGLLEGKELSI